MAEVRTYPTMCSKARCKGRAVGIVGGPPPFCDECERARELRRNPPPRKKL